MGFLRPSTLIIFGLCLVGLCAAANLAIPAAVNDLAGESPLENEITEKANIFTNPLTPPRPGNLIHRILKRFLAAVIRLLRVLLHKFQSWVLHTSNYLELLEVRQVFGPAIGKLIHRLVVWLRSFVTRENECIGRVLCELSDQASGIIPGSLKQVLLIYFSANQQASHYYQPLANGFISQSSCARLYSQCDQQSFLNKLDHLNVTVPDFYEDNDVHDQTMTTFGKTIPVVAVPIVQQTIPFAKAATDDGVDEIPKV